MTALLRLLAFCFITVVLWKPAQAAQEDAVLCSAVIISRHGVRTPNRPNEQISDYATQPWPKWAESPGILTAHGRQLMVLMGAYYRARYQVTGLLSGKSEDDAARVYVRAHNMERTMETACALAEGCLGKIHVDIHTLPADQTDPLFAAAAARVGHPDHALAAAAVRGRVGGDLTRFEQAYRGQFDDLARILSGRADGILPHGKVALLDLPASIEPGRGEKLLDPLGPLGVASELVENFVLEYADGRPEVGWGRITRKELADCYILHALQFDLTQRTFYIAQAGASVFAEHLLCSFEQTVSGRPVAGAFAPPGTSLVIEVGHDGNIANLAGLLGLSWGVDGLPDSPTLPGGALVFELWQRHSDRQFFVRAYYIAQTLDQMRSGSELTVQSPPAIAPLFIPGCSSSQADFDAPLARFQEQLHRVIDPAFVTH